MKAFKGMQAAPSTSHKTLHRLIAALALLAAVVVGFSLTVFAYFTDSLVNAGNTIAAGRFSADLAVTADENGDTALYTQAGAVNVNTEVTLDGYAGQTVYVRVAAGADSTVAFQFRLTVEGGGSTLLAVPESGANPVLEPGGEALVYAVEVPADGRITLRLDTAFRTGVLTGAATTTTTTTTAAPTTTTVAAPADNGLTGEPTADTPIGPVDTTTTDEGESTTTTSGSAGQPSSEGEPTTDGQTADEQTTTAAAVDEEGDPAAPSGEDGAATTTAADAAAE